MSRERWGFLRFRAMTQTTLQPESIAHIWRDVFVSQLAGVHAYRSDAKCEQVSIASGISFGVMPKRTVYLQGNTLTGQEEVERIASDGMLLLKDNPERVEAQAHLGLNAVFSAVEKPAPARAKSRFFGLVSKHRPLLATADAGDCDLFVLVGATTSNGANHTLSHFAGASSDSSPANHARAFDALPLADTLALARAVERAVTVNLAQLVRRAAYRASQLHTLPLGLLLTEGRAKTGLCGSIKAACVCFAAELTGEGGRHELSPKRDDLPKQKGGARSLGCACQRVITPLKPMSNFTTLAHQKAAA